MATKMVMKKADRMVVNMTKLDKLNKKIIDCTKCANNCIINLPQPGYFCGNILFVLQNPGIPATDAVKAELMKRNDYKQFQDSYKNTIQKCYMGKFISLIVDDWSKISITNVVKCPTPKNKFPTFSVISNCFGYLHKQIDLLSPKLIVCVGALSKSVIYTDEFKHYERIEIPHYSYINRLYANPFIFVNKVKAAIEKVL